MHITSCNMKLTSKKKELLSQGHARKFGDHYKTIMTQGANHIYK